MSVPGVFEFGQVGRISVLSAKRTSFVLGFCCCSSGDAARCVKSAGSVTLGGVMEIVAAGCELCCSYRSGVDAW